MRKAHFFQTVIVLLLLEGLASCVKKNEAQFRTIDESSKTETIIESVKIDKVWSGHPVGFCLLTHESRQYIAFYSADRHMMVGQRDLTEKSFSLYEMPPVTVQGTTTLLGWDSHNYVTMAIDKEGFIHLSGNMHSASLTYFKSTAPADISTLVQEAGMVGANENRCTYPKFLFTRDGELIFHYRDGSSGDGNEIFNIYSCGTKSWSRLLDTPLTNGQGLMNAYMSEPILMADNWYHVYWVWRDTPDCSTNHDLSYIKSPNLKNWYNAHGEPVTLPVTIDNKSIIVDPIPVRGGIINLAARLCLDENNNPFFAYHKYDSQGNLQFYVAHFENKMWVSKQITNWDYRWEFSGGGSIIFEVRLNDFKKRSDGYFELSYGHVKYGTGTLLLDKKLNICGIVNKPKSFTETLKLEGIFPGLSMKTSADTGESGEQGIRYALKWETLPTNRDQARPEPWPEPSQLYLYKLKVEE